MKDNQKLLVMCGLRRGRMIGFDSVPNRSTTSYICKYTVRTKFKLILLVFVAAKASDVFFLPCRQKMGISEISQFYKKVPEIMAYLRFLIM